MEESPALVYYENNIPFLYKRSLKYEEGLLKWLVEQGGNSIGLKKLDDFLAELLMIMIVTRFLDSFA